MLEDTRTAFFPHHQLRSFLVTLTGGTALKNTSMLWIEPADSGRTIYSKGDCCCFTVFAGPGGEDKLRLVVKALQGLPDSFPQSWQMEAVFHRNVRLDSLRD